MLIYDLKIRVDYNSLIKRIDTQIVCLISIFSSVAYIIVKFFYDVFITCVFLFLNMFVSIIISI
jgi:hypothetical protein